MDERQARVGRNEALFRAVNEHLEDLNEAFATVADAEFEVVCECGDAACVEQILIPAAEYVRVRTDPTLCIMTPRHEDATVEAVIENDHATYHVIRKRPGEPADLAAETAPQ
jgi:hypothetical protein